MTVGELRESLPIRGTPEYDLPVRVRFLTNVGVGVHDDSVEWLDHDVESINKVFLKGNDFYRIEIA